MANRAMIEQQLRDAERHVADGRDIVAQQQMIIAELEVDGHDAVQARALLKTYQGIQHMLEAHRDRLKETLLVRVLKCSLLH